jgi:hypothetical protein
MTFTYGVFRLGQIWTIVCDDDTRMGFPTREEALLAVIAIASIHRAGGSPVKVVVQDRGGRLRTVLDPVDVTALSRLPLDDSWALFRSPEWKDVNDSNVRHASCPPLARAREVQ